MCVFFFKGVQYFADVGLAERHNSQCYSRRMTRRGQAVCRLMSLRPFSTKHKKTQAQTCSTPFAAWIQIVQQITFPNKHK